MGLGSDNTVCKDVYVETMRARLESDEPGLGAAVDKPGAQKNLGAYGEALYRIATEHAETFSDPDADADFWTWIAAVEAWLADMAAWQQGMAAAFNNWDAHGAADQQLKTAITSLSNPASPPPAPASLQGKIR
jgi:hypothetical protein